MVHEYGLTQYLADLKKNNEKYDSILLSGVLFNAIDIKTMEKNNDLETLKLSLDIVSPEGFVVLIVPLVYFPNHEKYDFISQATWKYKSIERLLKAVSALKAMECLTHQIGLGDRVRQQSVKPDWLAAKPEEAGRWLGSEMAAWSIVLSPRGSQ